MRKSKEIRVSSMTRKSISIVTLLIEKIRVASLRMQIMSTILNNIIHSILNLTK